MRLFKAAFVALLLSFIGAPAIAWPVHGSGNPYANACPSATNNWCVAADGWTVFTPTTTGTGACGATGTFTGTCVTYIAENGTGTSSTCRIAATSGFAFTATITDAQACPYTETSMALARDNSPDFLLFKRGDCFMAPGLTSSCTGIAAPSTNSWGICTARGTGCRFDRNGLSPAAPLLVSAYGQVTGARPRISTFNFGFASQAGSGNNLALVSVAFDGGQLFNDYNNSTYNAGFITAASGSAAGATTITLSSAPPSNIVNNANVGGWQIMNFSNSTEMMTDTGLGSMWISSISGATVTLLSPIPAGWDVNAGDRMVFMPAISGAGGLNNNGIPLAWSYLEDCLFAGSGVSYQSPGAGELLTIYMRRNQIYDASFVGTRMQGLFLGDSFNSASTVLFEENLVDHSGWRQVDGDCVPGQFLPAKCGGVASEQFENFYGSPNNQAHNAYDHENCCALTFTRNILTNPSGANVQVRSGGILYNNFMAQGNTAATGGGILHPNTVSHNVMSNLTYSYTGIMKVTGVSGNVLTFAHVPLVLGVYPTQPFNASNPSGISQTLNTSFTFTKTTVTIGGPAISVSVGDTIYFVGTGSDAAGWGYIFAASDYNTNNAHASNVQWNIVTNDIPLTYKGFVAGGFAFNADQSASRATGSVFANNYMMNVLQGILDATQIQSIDGNAACGGAVRIGIRPNASSTTSWLAGDTIVISGALPTSMNANGSFTVASVSSPSLTYLCLNGSTFGTGTWTSGTGVINGGIAWGPNYYYNVTTPSDTTASAPTLLSPAPQTAGCPQALGCPSVEAYSLSIGGDGTLAHIVSNAKLNRKGNWDTRYTANAINNYVRSKTSATIPLQ